MHEIGRFSTTVLQAIYIYNKYIYFISILLARIIVVLNLPILCNKLFKDLEEWKSNAVQIESSKEHFLEEYPKIFNISTENEVEMETTMETESRPIVDREEKLQKAEEKLLHNKTTYDGVMSDDGLTLPEKVILLQKAIDDATRKKQGLLHFVTRTIA